MVWSAAVILEPLSIVVTFQIDNIQLACIAGLLPAMVRGVTMRKSNSPMVIVRIEGTL